MKCPSGCGGKVTKALKAVEGVEEVAINFKAKLATCKIDAKKFVAEDAIKALVAAGYKGTVQDEST